MLDPSKKLDRFLMFIPGFLTWTMLLMPVWLGYFYPQKAAFILTFLGIYWVYMSIKHAYGLQKGYKRHVKEMKIDWYAKCANLDFDKLPNQKTLPKRFKDLKHFVLIPTVTEDYEILEPTFLAIMNQSFPANKITVVVGTEEIGKEKITKNLEKLEEKYGDKLPRILHYIHPKGIPHEIVGVASPNRTWAAKHAIAQLKKEGANINDYIFSTFDSDGIIHKHFLARIAYAYLTDSKRFNRHYETAVVIYTNNYWQVPVISRMEANNITFGRLSNHGSDDTPRISETFSCYSCALDTLIAANYWDVKFIDDTVFFWRAFRARNGDFEGTYHYLPIYSDATGGENYLRAHKNLFRQLVRWGWGSIATPVALKLFITGQVKKTPLKYKLLWGFVKFERHVLMRTSVFLVSFGFTIVTFVNHQFRSSATVYGLPQIISMFLSGAMIMFIPLTIIRKKFYPIPKEFGLIRRIRMLFESPVVIINLLTFSFLPFLIAETMMMFGKVPKVTFYTPKVRT